MKQAQIATFAALIVLLVACSGADASPGAFSRALGSDGGEFAYVAESLEVYVDDVDLVVRGRSVGVSNHVTETVEAGDQSYEVGYYHLVVEVLEVMAGSVGDGEWEDGVVHVVMSVGDGTSYGAIEDSLPGSGVESVHFLQRARFPQDPGQAEEGPLWVHAGYPPFLLRAENGTVLWGEEGARTPAIFVADGEVSGDGARGFDVLVERIREAVEE